MKKLLLAFQFLTIVPLKKAQHASDSDIAGSSSFFVPVGIIQGFAVAVAYYVSGFFFHPDLAIALALLALVLSNGGFHLDGLADTFDAIAAKSSGDSEADREKRLSIMKGSTTGPIGITAIVFALALKYLALKNISNFSYFTWYSSLVLLPVVPKWTMVVSMFHARPARQHGLGKVFIEGTGIRETGASTLIFIAFLLLPALILRNYISGYYPMFCVALFISMYVVSRILVRFFDGKFGGLTGDTIGAISELSEVCFLCMVIIWSRLFI